MAKQYLGTLEVGKASTQYIVELEKELAHYKQGSRWIENQNGIPVDITDEIKKLAEEIEDGLTLEYTNIKQQVMDAYPNATGYDLGDGVVYVWRE